MSVVWALDRVEVAGLQVQIEALRQENLERDALHRERARLQREAALRAERRRDVIEHAHVDNADDTPRAAPRTPPLTALVVGEWLSSVSWANRGQSTPIAAIETTLWAAAGGDIVALKNLVQLDDPVRAAAEALLSRLPASTRSIYTSPEHLVAAFTIQSIPIGHAQLVWHHQPSADEAFACVFVQNPDASPTAAPSAAPPDEPNTPPSNPAVTNTRAAYLSLRRADAGWQLVVPASAIDQIAKEIGAPK